MVERAYMCGLGPAFLAIGGKWKAAILWELRGDPVRFRELKRRIPGITEKMLIQNLKEMESDQLVHRQAYFEIPPRVEYSLTPHGLSLNKALGSLADWGEDYAKAVGRYGRE